MSTKYESQVSCTKQKTANTKVWDGYLELNSALTVATVAFFKSGEKMPEIKWPDRVEVKGKVKLHEFETYIRDLPNSPNRRLMVVSLYWKEESSKEKLEGIKKVGRKYVKDGRVGIAKVISGVDLYVCPCSYTILNLFAKHGFYHSNDKKTNNDFLVGCIVWKRNQINHPPIEEWSPIREPCKSSVQNYPFPIYSDLVKCSEEDAKQSSPTTAAILEKEQAVSDFEVGTSNEVSHQRMMEEDMDISPQKKPCYRDDNENIPNFIAPSPAAKILPPVLIPKNDFTYLGPSLMREQTHSHAYVNPKPDFTYLGPVLMREQANAREKTKTGDFNYSSWS